MLWVRAPRPVVMGRDSCLRGRGFEFPAPDTYCMDDFFVKIGLLVGKHQK